MYPDAQRVSSQVPRHKMHFEHGGVIGRDVFVVEIRVPHAMEPCPDADFVAEIGASLRQRLDEEVKGFGLIGAGIG